MLKISDYVQKGIYERIVRSQNGSLVRVFFEVYECNGSLKGRVLHVQPILALNGNAAKKECLALAGCVHTPVVILDNEKSFTSVLSPYNELFFFTSQPTRAPSNN